MIPQQQSYRTILLTQGQVAIVDEQDYEWLIQWKWRVWWSPRTKSFYASRVQKGRHVSMHREILGLTPGDPRHGDHKEAGQTLDNRRSNLRIATRSENRRNSRLGKNNRSGFKGVSWRAQTGKWVAFLKTGGRTRYLGCFVDPNTAHEAYCVAARESFGEFART